MGYDFQQPRGNRPIRPRRPCPRPFPQALTRHLLPVPVPVPAPQVRSDDSNWIDPLISGLKSMGEFLTSPRMIDLYVKCAAEYIQQRERERRLRSLLSRLPKR